ncbi:hypothetical protein NHX12_030999 [Muraenolepis orangiensis]|uniref:Uncharacterized protein n=1 Tax=Muraenolepis orangiensis TaxID=630683 RepID=A0A9Q0EF32_9TELE|nr:hypothetical protein NHX12_030999 [Muraenolepis orangiensis]
MAARGGFQSAPTGVVVGGGGVGMGPGPPVPGGGGPGMGPGTPSSGRMGPSSGPQNPMYRSPMPGPGYPVGTKPLAPGRLAVSPGRFVWVANSPS